MSEQPIPNNQSSGTVIDAIPVEQQTENVATTVLSDDATKLTELEHKANKIIKNHVLCSMGAGLIPIPLADIAAVTAIQVDALKSLAELHGVEVPEGSAKAMVTGLAGSTLAKIGASAVKLVPGVGTMAGGLTMAGLSGASTYAICQAAQNQFVTKGTFLDFNMTDAKEAYAVALDKGKELVKNLEEKKDQAVAKFEEIQKLQQEKAEGRITEEEFAKKQENIMSKDDVDKAS